MLQFCHYSKTDKILYNCKDKGQNSSFSKNGPDFIISMFKKTEIFKSITRDNDLEFASLDKNFSSITDSYSHSYSSWERGFNERHNGLLRRFIPKYTTFGILNLEVPLVDKRNPNKKIWTKFNFTNVSY